MSFVCFYRRDTMLARIYALAFLSVCCLCVTHMLWIEMTELSIIILLPPDSPIILVFRRQVSLLNSDGFTLMGRQIQGAEKIARFLTNKSVYLGNGARYGRSCYRTRIGNYTQATK